MDPHIEGIYVDELITQCQNALAAVNRMNAILKAQDQGAAEFFREATDLLQHAAAASRLIWPPGGPSAERRARAEARGTRLRESLQIEGDHVLKGRRLRDHLEHAAD